MTRNILDTLIESQLEAFANSYKNTAHDLFYDENSKTLIHPGEFGGLRESLFRDLLKNFLPEEYGVSQGFVISPAGDVSNQCDVIIYSSRYTPVIHTPEHQRFFPVESVVAVGEVKSIVDSNTLRDALTKLVRVKEIRANLKSPAIVYQRPQRGEYNPTYFERDQIGTFVLAESISCQKRTVASLVREVVEEKHQSLKVNLIASINDYCTTYRDPEIRSWIYPHHLDDTDLPLQFELSTGSQRIHLKFFVRYILMIVQSATVMFPELTEYLGNFRGLHTVVEDDL